MSQIDIKKIIALSTTSQLSLIIIVCCTGQYDLAFMHLVFHGFFKALLFLGRGVIIHSSPTSSQDSIKLNLFTKRSPFLQTVFTFGVLGLMGAPFMGSFHRKHLILDNVLSVSYSGFTRILVYVALYLSPVLTLGYSLKLLFIILRKPASEVLTLSYIKGSYTDLEVVVPLSLLCLLSFATGLSFWQRITAAIDSLLSCEDIFFSLFLFVFFIGFLYYIVIIQHPTCFLYNISDFIAKVNILHLRNLLTLHFFHLVEILYIKKGLKLVFPVYGMRKGPNVLFPKCFSLEICIFIYLYNLASVFLLLLFLLIFLALS